MKNNSKIVTSNQNGIHQNLEKTVVKHRDSDYRKPYQAHNLQAFECAVKAIQVEGRKLILDSCCGTGQSSEWLARCYPEALVIGVDQSAVRLSKRQQKLDNLLLLRANCEDLWRLFVRQGILFEKHYILYPNPWPKSVHLKRRWHGHPVFRFLPKLSQQVELRSNWKTYLDEFAQGWKLLTGEQPKVEHFEPQNYLTLFEKKYHQSGQPLYRLRCQSKL